MTLLVIVFGKVLCDLKGCIDSKGDASDYLSIVFS